MCVCVCVCVRACVHVCYRLISEYKDFAIQMSFRWMGWDVKGQNYFCCKNLLLRRYGSFNSLVLHHFELLMSTEKLQKVTILFHSQSH